MNKTTVIHIGHSKTGSSALQTFFARNVELLRSFGVHYPSQKSLDSAKAGKISSGNILSFYEDDLSSDATTLYSSELFFQKFKTGEDFVRKLQDNSDRVKLFCFTRDLFDHFFSSYGQWIKRGGGTSGIYDFSKAYRNYNIVLDVIEFCNANGIELEVKNYSRHSDEIESVFMKYLLKDDHASFMRQSSNVNFKVNRSLTSSEAMLQQSFNLYFGRKSCRMISDALVNELPDLNEGMPRICEKTVEQVISTNGSVIERINSYLPQSEKISLVIPENAIKGNMDSDDECRLSTAQLNTVVSSIHKTLAPNMAVAISGHDVNDIRDLALKIAAGEEIELEDALVLMKIASKGRPDAAGIKKQISQWEASKVA